MTRHTDGRAARWAQVFRTPMGVVSAVLLLVVVVTAVLAPLLWGDQAAEVHPNAILEGASADHPLGTDAVGRDNFLRLLVATRLSVVLALLATAVGVGTGVLLGTAPSVLPRWSGRLITAGVNIASTLAGSRRRSSCQRPPSSSALYGLSNFLTKSDADCPPYMMSPP